MTQSPLPPDAQAHREHLLATDPWFKFQVVDIQGVERLSSALGFGAMINSKTLEIHQHLVTEGIKTESAVYHPRLRLEEELPQPVRRGNKGELDHDPSIGKLLWIDVESRGNNPNIPRVIYLSEPWESLQNGRKLTKALTVIEQDGTLHRIQLSRLTGPRPDAALKRVGELLADLNVGVEEFYARNPIYPEELH